MLPLLLLACVAGTTDATDLDLSARTAANDPLPAGAELDAPLSVLFAPDDPVTTLELTLLQEVVDARLADGGDYAEGENPFRIRYAVYNLRNADVIDALLAAEDAGVDVQVLIEADQLDAERDWNTVDEQMLEHGLEVVYDDDDAYDPATADLVGIDDSGLMHLKTRLFETPDRSRLLTGSMNPGDNAIYNDETLHLVNDPAVVGRYAAAYDAVLANDDFANEWDEDAAVNVLFSPAASGPRIGGRILDWLAEEDEQILMMVYSLRDFEGEGHTGSLVDVLAERVATGVPVVVVTDRKQSDDYYDSTEDALRAVGVTVYEVRNETNEYTAMHHKVAVLGRTDVRIITDAANWTKAALGTATDTSSNLESALFIDSTALDDGLTGRRYLRQVLATLDRYADQLTEDGELSADDQRAFLLGQEGWPTEDSWFSADQAETIWGEWIWVRGDAEELGYWGIDDPGLQLITDELGYPSWWASEPVALPVGSPVQWKFVAQPEGGTARWESGDNRSFRAGPTALLPETEIGGSWRY